MGRQLEMRLLGPFNTGQSHVDPVEGGQNSAMTELRVCMAQIERQSVFDDVGNLPSLDV
jgi:hypothetical protein